MRLSLTLVVLLLGGALSGCSNQGAQQHANSSSSEPLLSQRIYAVSYPLQFLTQQITGDEIEVLLPFEQTVDPRTARPTRETIEAMQKSDLVIANGIGASYAKWLAVVSLSDSKIVNAASRGLALKEYIAIKGDSIVHSHGPQGEHSHPIMAARTWLDPALAKKQATYIATRLKRVYPDQAGRFDKNLEGLQIRLDELVAAMGRLHGQESKSVIVLTAGSEFEFFIRAAGFTSQPLPGFSSESQIPEAQLLDGLKTRLKSLGGTEVEEGEMPRLVFCNSQLAAKENLSQLFLSFEIQPVGIDLLDQPPLAGDYFTVMESNIACVEAALQR